MIFDRDNDVEAYPGSPISFFCVALLDRFLITRHYVTKKPLSLYVAEAVLHMRKTTLNLPYLIHKKPQVRCF